MHKGVDDGVSLSIAAWEEREKMYRHRDKIYAAEYSRLKGEKSYSQSELDAEIDRLFVSFENRAGTPCGLSPIRANLP